VFFFKYLELNEHQLYFINENQVRYSALESSLLVPPDIHFVQLTWSEDRFDIDTVSHTKQCPT